MQQLANQTTCPLARPQQPLPRAAFSSRRSWRRFHTLQQRWGRHSRPVIVAAEPDGADQPLYLHNGRPHLPISLFRPFDKLPPDGQTLTPEEEGCNPEEGLCKTKMHVWEVKCTACWGTGTIISNGRHGHRSMTTCLICTGLGYVRHTSSKVEPVKEEKDSEVYYTLGRPPPPPPKQLPKKKGSGAASRPIRGRPPRR